MCKLKEKNLIDVKKKLIIMQVHKFIAGQNKNKLVDNL